YAAFAAPRPVSITKAQALLADDEILLQIVTTPRLRGIPSETYVWLIARREARWAKVELDPDKLTDHVQALRCGLDRAAWDGPSLPHCTKRLGFAISSSALDAGQSLPFDLARAHELFLALFGPFAEAIRDKHLLIVPSGPLTTLPFHVLLAERSTGTV